MKCVKCNGTGFISKRNEFEEDIAHPCECRKEKDATILLETRLIDASIPRRYWGYTLDNYLALPFSPDVKLANKQSIEKLSHYINNPKSIDTEWQVIWLWGKEDNACHSTLAVILATELLKLNYKVKFINIQDLLNSFTDFKDKSVYFKELEDYNVYILDDIFDVTRSHVTGDYTKINFYNWINAAFNNDKKFICTSNIPLMQADPIYSQIKTILTRNYTQFEIQGSLTTYLRKN